MNYLLLFLAGLIIVQAAQLQYTEGYRDAIKKYYKHPNHLTALLITTTATDCQKCEQAQTIYEEFMYEVDNVVKTYILDCKVLLANPEERDIIPACEISHVDLLPALTFLTPPKQDNNAFDTPQSKQPVENQFKGSLSLAALLESVEKLAPIYSVIIEDIEYFDSVFLKDTTRPTKVILLKPDEKVPLWWRGLTSSFRNRIDFAELDSDEVSLGRRYKISGNYPDILVLKYDLDRKKYNQHVYTGEKTYEDIEQYLKGFALKEETKLSRSIYDEDPKKWNQVEDITHLQFKRVLELKEQWAMVHIWDQTVPHPLYKMLKKNFKGLMRLFSLTCTGECKVWAQRKLKVTSFPALLIYPFNGKLIDKAIIVRNKDDLQGISEVMLDTLISQTSSFTNTDDSTILLELQRSRDMDLFPVLWLYDSNNHFWNLLGATVSSMTKYTKHLRFLFNKNPTKEEMENWQAQKLPAIMTFAEINYDSGQHKKYDFNGPETFENLLSYLNQVASENEKTKIAYKPVEQAKTQDDFERLCLNPGVVCVIAFIETVKEGKFQKDQDALNQLRTHYKDKNLSWLWIDGRCQNQLIRELHITKVSLSTMILFNPQKSKYVAMEEGEFSLKRLVQFVDVNTEKGGKKKFKPTNESFELQDKNCERILEQLRIEYQTERKRRQQLFVQAERERDKDLAKVRRLKEQRALLEDDTEIEQKDIDDL